MRTYTTPCVIACFMTIFHHKVRVFNIYLPYDLESFYYLCSLSSRSQVLIVYIVAAFHRTGEGLLLMPATYPWPTKRQN